VSAAGGDGGGGGGGDGGLDLDFSPRYSPATMEEINYVLFCTHDGFNLRLAQFSQPSVVPWNERFDRSLARFDRRE